jgi:hypothetical protein
MQLGNDQLRADRSNAGAEPFALCGRKFIFFFSLPWPRTRQGFPASIRVEWILPCDPCLVPMLIRWLIRCRRGNVGSRGKRRGLAAPAFPQTADAHAPSIAHGLMVASVVTVMEERPASPRLSAAAKQITTSQLTLLTLASDSS